MQIKYFNFGNTNTRLYQKQGIFENTSYAELPRIL